MGLHGMDFLLAEASLLRFFCFRAVNVKREAATRLLAAALAAAVGLQRSHMGRLICSRATVSALPLSRSTDMCTRRHDLQQRDHAMACTDCQSDNTQQHRQILLFGPVLPVCANMLCRMHDTHSDAAVTYAHTHTLLWCCADALSRSLRHLFSLVEMTDPNRLHSEPRPAINEAVRNSGRPHFRHYFWAGAALAGLIGERHRLGRPRRHHSELLL